MYSENVYTIDEISDIALGQIIRSSIERRKYCYLGLQPVKSSDTPTTRVVKSLSLIIF